MRVPDLQKCHIVLSRPNSDEAKNIICTEIFNKIHYLNAYIKHLNVQLLPEIRPFEMVYTKEELLEKKNNLLVIESINDELIPYFINDQNYEYHDILYLVKYFNKFTNSTIIISKYLNIHNYSMVTRQARSWRPENA